LARKIIGILGGMGPEATSDLFRRIIRATPAERDQDHIRVIIDSNTSIPDRTGAIMGGGPSPLPEMMETGKNLERAGADLIIMPCNTAHYFYRELQGGLGVPLLDMIGLTARRIRDGLPDVRRVGLIATTGTLRTGIYERALEPSGVEVIAPSAEDQERVMEAIYDDIKTGKIAEGKEIVAEVAAHLVEKGAEAVICGCTEISLVLEDGDLPVPVVDPLQVLAEAAVAEASGR